MRHAARLALSLVSGPMLELDAEPHAELLEIAPERTEVDLELSGDGARLLSREVPLRGQLCSSHCHLLGDRCD